MDAKPHHNSMIRRLLRWLKFGFKGLVYAVLVYLLILLVGLIPVNNDFVPTEDGIRLYFVSNIAHTDLIVPKSTQVIYWEEELAGSQFGGDISDQSHVAFGLGDQGFFVETKTWDDFRISTAASALLLPSESCLHVAFVRPESDMVSVTTPGLVSNDAVVLSEVLFSERCTGELNSSHNLFVEFLVPILFGTFSLWFTQLLELYSPFKIRTSDKTQHFFRSSSAYHYPLATNRKRKMIRGQNIIPLLHIFLGIIASYFIVKFSIRPLVIENQNSGLIKTIAFSYPNFCEAVVGTIFLTLLLLILKGMLMKRKPNLVFKEKYVYQIAVLISGIYVILQEFKVHNLGGENVFDFNDVFFSILGLIMVYFVLIKIKPKIIGGQNGRHNATSSN